MATTTPLKLITRALKKSGVLGVGQTAAAEDTNDAFDDLNDMIAQWQIQRWMVYHLVDVALTSTGAQSYTVGLGGDFNVARPDRLEAAFFRQLVPSVPNQVDYPLRLLESREDYNRIRLKTLVAFSSAIFYDAAYPLGSVYPVPVLPATQYALHLTLKATLGEFTSLAQTVNLPAQYNQALIYNLAARLRPSYQLPPDPQVTALALTSLNVIKNSNAQIPVLRLPGALRHRSNGYNYFSDNSN